MVRGVGEGHVAEQGLGAIDVDTCQRGDQLNLRYHYRKGKGGGGGGEEVSSACCGFVAGLQSLSRDPLPLYPGPPTQLICKKKKLCGKAWVRGY